MFRWLGKAIAQGWPAILVIWLATLGALELWGTRWDDVARGGEFTFLPADSPSRHGEALFKHGFPDDLLASSIVIVLHRDAKGEKLTAADRTFISDVLEPRLEKIADEGGGLAASAPETAEVAKTADRKKIAGHSPIADIRTFAEKGIGALLVSEDEQASLVILDLTTDFIERRNFPIVERVERELAEVEKQELFPDGLEMQVTGSATLGRDLTRAQQQSADAAHFWTIVLVIAFLAFIYRAPLLALVPLLTVALAVEVSIRLLAVFAQLGWLHVFEGLQVYIMVVAYGAGVDYCLFLTARYRESLEQGDSIPDAIANSVGNVGAAITASAGTVVCGIAMLTFARFGKFHEAGIGMSFSLFVVFCAVLTFTPALLRMAGCSAFWPAQGAVCLQKRDVSPRKSFLNQLMDRYPLGNIWQRISSALERRPGTIWLCSVGAMLPFVIVALYFFESLSYGLIDQLPRTAPSVAGAKVLGDHFPQGITGAVTVLLKNPQVDFSESENVERIGDLVDRLKQRHDELEVADIRSVATPLGTSTAADRAFQGLSATEKLVARSVLKRHAVDYYVSRTPDVKNHLTRLDLVLNSDPFARDSIADLSKIEQAISAELPQELRGQSELYYLGPTASVRDLKAVADHDRVLVNSLVVLVVFSILVILLRKVVVSFYLVASVLVSYLATLGVTFVLFWLLDRQHFPGLDWTVPMFLFTLLVAVGEDYNIFLMTRVHEEQDRHGPIKGISVALERTGGIITSCGFIMAGTFASLTAGSLVRMTQLGFALAFGILLDTFIVRPILVPAFLILLENGTFGSVGKYLGARGKHARV